jgi:hypothetical protein
MFSHRRVAIAQSARLEPVFAALAAEIAETRRWEARLRAAIAELAPAQQQRAHRARLPLTPRAPR